jgi:hypothetical protein
VSRKNALRKANKIAREHLKIASPARADAEITAQTPAAQYEAEHSLRDWYRGQCQCAECLKAGAKTQPLLCRDGHRASKSFIGRRVPKPACMLAVRREWDPELRQVVRTELGTIEYGDFLDGREMSDDATEIAASTEPARVVTGGIVRRNDAKQMGLRQRRTRVVTVALTGHCAICHDPKENGFTYCMTCRTLLRADGRSEELAARLAMGEKARA